MRAVNSLGESPGGEELEVLIAFEYARRGHNWSGKGQGREKEHSDDQDDSIHEEMKDL
jgi:hypothetical protein